MSYREIEHLSDRAILITATSLTELFQDAIEGLYAVMEIVVTPQTAGAAVERDVMIEGPDTESLLVGLLSECLNIADLDRLAAVNSQISLTPAKCLAHLKLVPIEHMRVNIKAVTYSQMKITLTNGIYQTIVVFDS